MIATKPTGRWDITDSILWLTESFVIVSVCISVSATTAAREVLPEPVATSSSVVKNSIVLMHIIVLTLFQQMFVNDIL